MEASPPPHVCVVNDWSERVGGRELRFAYGEEGQARVAVPPLSLTPAERQRLAASRVVLVPGGPWPGVEENGAAWLGPWCRALTAAGVGEAIASPLFTHEDPVTATWQTLTEDLTHWHAGKLVAHIESALRRHPLGPNGRLYLLGHSYGSRPAFAAIERLRAHGIPVSGAIVLGTYLPTTGHFLHAAPNTPRLLEVENIPDQWLTPWPGAHTTRLLLPELTHMGLVLRPPDRLLEAVVREVASE